MASIISPTWLSVNAVCFCLSAANFLVDLNGLIHLGEKQFGGGRVGEKAATGITEDLVSLGFGCCEYDFLF